MSTITEHIQLPSPPHTPRPALPHTVVSACPLSPSDLPEATKRQNISEPYVRMEMVTPAEYVGNLMELATGRRGEFVEMKYLTGAEGLWSVLAD